MIINYSRGVDSSGYSGTGEILMGISGAECGVAVTLLGLRLYSALKGVGKGLDWDFWWCALATATGIAAQALYVGAVYSGVGRHVHELSFSQLWSALYYIWMGLITGLVATATAKLGLIALYLRVTPESQRYRRALLWSLAAFSTMVSASQLVIMLLQCQPYTRLWNRYEPGTCKLTNLSIKYSYFQGAVAAFCDLMLAAYPITIVWVLRINFRLKVGFCVLMIGGVMPAVASLIRTAYISRLYDASDPTYAFVPFLAWCATELWVIVIAASIPPVRPLFLESLESARGLLERKFGWRPGGGTQSQRQGKVESKGSRDTLPLSGGSPGCIVVVRDAGTMPGPMAACSETKGDEIVMQRTVHICESGGWGGHGVLPAAGAMSN